MRLVEFLPLITEGVNDPGIFKAIFMGGGPGCFDEDTLIKTDIGYKKILDVKCGDSIWTIDNNNNRVLERVEKIFSYFAKNEMIEIILENNEKIVCTPDHKIKLKDGSWIEAQNLTEKSDILLYTKNSAKVKSVNRITNYNKEYVYDLKVSNNHNYFVGKSEINVHNSGKTTVAGELFGIPRKLSFSPHGLKVFNSDREFEHMLKKAGISADLTSLNDEENWQIYATENPESIYSRAKLKAAIRYKHYLDGRIGMLIDITARNRQRVLGLKTQLEEMGYDTHMVFVNTTLEKALERNLLRKRKLKHAMVNDMWHQVQENLGYFKNLFGANFLEVENNAKMESGKLELPANAHKAINKWAGSPVKNSIAKQWIKNAKKYKVDIGADK